MTIRVLMVGADVMVGGIPNYIAALAALCDSNQVEFHMTVSGAPNPQVAARFERIVKHHQPIDYSFLSLPARVMQLRRLLLQEHFDVIHLHAARAGLLGCLAAYGLPVGVVYTGHSWRFAQKSTPVGQWIFALYERFICSRSDVITFIRECDRELGIARRLIKPNKAITIPTRIDTRQFECIGTEAGLQRKMLFGIPADAPVVGMVGRLHELKDPLTFVRVGAKVRTTTPEIYLLWVGDGEMREAVISLAAQLEMSDRLVITGLRSEEEIPAFLQAMDVFVCTSRIEGVPLSILEAQAARRPVISSAYAGVEEVLEHEITGYCYPVGDSGRAAEYVTYLLHNPSQASSLAWRAHQRLLKDHSDPAQMARQYEAVYLNVLHTTHASTE